MNILTETRSFTEMMMEILIDELIPNIKFENVNFSYPSSNQLILKILISKLKKMKL